MLVLSRHKDERIVLFPGTPLETFVSVEDIRGDKVRIGIESPKSVVIHREEVWEQIKEERKQALCQGGGAT